MTKLNITLSSIIPNLKEDKLNTYSRGWNDCVRKIIDNIANELNKDK